MILRSGDEPIPGYRLEEFIGQGQFGQVWKARSPGKAFAALKFLDLSGKQGRKEFRAIQKVKEIRHAHLMPITALWLLDEEGNVLNDQVMDEMGSDSTLVSETLAVEEIPATPSKPALLVVAQLLGDKTLGDRLQECLDAGEAGVPAAELIAYMEEAAKGIDYLNSAKHDLGSGIFAIQHCDIKPANILLAGDSVLICDFGVAHALADSDRGLRATGMVGSPAYMAPECIGQQPSSTSDQYSLAVTYYELRTGHLPFSKTTFADVMDAHRTGTLDLNKLPPAEKKVIKKATAIDPKKRYRSSVDMVSALRAAALGERRPTLASRGTLLIGTLLLVLGCLIVYRTFRPAQVDPGTTPFRQVRILIEPANGELVINGQAQKLDVDGTVEIECKSADELAIEAWNRPEYEDYQETIHVADLPSNTIHIRLDHSASFHAEKSRRLLDAGKFDEAVDQWALAVDYDANGEFQITPGPTARRAVGPGGLLLAGVSPTRDWVATVDSSGVLQLWRLDDPTQAEPVLPFDRETDTAPWSVAVSDRWAVVTYLNGEIRVVDLSQSPPAQRFTLDVKPNRGPDQAEVEQIEVAISQDDRWLITTSSAAEEVGAAVVHRWDLQTESPSPELLGSHHDSIPGLAVNATSVFTVSWDGSVRGWPLVSGAPVRDAPIAEHTDDINCLAVGQSIVAVGGHGSLAAANQSAPAGQHRITLCRDEEGCTSLPVGHSSPIEFLALTASESWLVSGCEDLRESEIHAWDLRGDLASPIVLRAGHRGVVESVCFSTDEQWMVTGGDDGQVLLWDFQDLNQPGPIRLKVSPGKIVLVTIDPSGRWLISYGGDGIWIWDLHHCTLVKRACDKAGVRPTPPDASSAPLVDA